MQSSDEELLREFSCNGDLHQIQTLLTTNSNLNINSQNSMNGWTALHWAAKRNHKHIVEYLLERGARKDIQTHDKLLPVNVSNNEKIQELLETTTPDNCIKHETNLPITPNYLRHPIFPYVSSQTTSTSTPTTIDNQTITLLCRIADDPSETDFIEFDFNKNPTNGSYERLASILRQEFDLDRINKIRRLPCMRIRNDRDVERLKDNQMLEIVLIKNDETSCS